MSSSIPSFKIAVQASFIFALLGNLAGCATSQNWQSAGGNRAQGVVRVSYEYPENHQPQMSEAQAGKLALSRCNAWGFRKAEPIEGQVRQCANMDDGNCDLWSVTREYQCSEGEGAYAARLSR
jgi:YecR-like lipoprotein